TTNSTASTNYTFTPVQAGNYNLEAQGLIFTQFPLGWGPGKLITVLPLVTTNADSGVGSLRQVASVVQGLGGTVTFATNLSGQTITLTSGEIAITNNLTIDASALPNGIIINGNHNSRIFNIAGGVAVTLNALVLTNGYTTNGNWGGAIFNAGTLALNYCTLAGNCGDSSIAGGAIANQGPLTVLGCTFSGNSAGFSGAIDNRSTCTLQNSTFYGNVAFAGNGGAIDNPFSATLSVLQCTFSGNSASSLGGAIDNYLSQVNITNTIVSGNTGQDIYNWSGSTIGAGGANIIPALANAGTLAGGGTISSANPLLGVPANHGGRTLTILPQSGSPAINAGVTGLAVGLAYDQRGPGYPRVVGSTVDIGAVEYEPLVITSSSSVTFLAGLSNNFILSATGALAATIAVTGTFPSGVTFTPPATLSGTPPDGSGGAWPLTVTASNG
ncbi:MAG TPA: choice-of-anchor Q domain-containing protein, partial [Candidatus Dormibacteraeota bacterium]|nr:choice-of-anchor Q domain-containing protein [Candidatus Dormibacteraeota bacterium]